ncbi:MAG: hypothetical protein HDT42_03140 [Ruminococcaceae bacterium]|nr:hypothetical protein [Oscillospiraceae bacterium]
MDDDSLLITRFIPILLTLGPKGECGLAFRDFDKPEGWSTAEIVVEIFPEVKYFGDLVGYD